MNMEPEEVTAALTAMKNDPKYITRPAYRGNGEVWPDHKISFVENHTAYLRAHPNIKPEHYIANLRLMLKKR